MKHVAAVLTPLWVCVTLSAGAKAHLSTKVDMTKLLDATTPPRCPNIAFDKRPKI